MVQVYKSRVDWWLAVALVLPVVGGVAAIVAGVAGGKTDVLLIGVGALVFYAAVLFGLVVPMEYAIHDAGLRVRAGRMRLEVPWDRLLGAEPSGNPLSSPALSLRRLNVTYRKPNGKQTFVLISPVDRDAFLRDLAARSPRHTLADGRLVER